MVGEYGGLFECSWQRLVPPWCEDCYLPELASKKVVASSYCMGIIDLLLACRRDQFVVWATCVSRFVIRAWGRLSAQTTGRSNSSGAEQKEKWFAQFSVN
jgi:hypothetical protein